MMRVLPSPRTVRRAEARRARHFLAAMALITLIFVTVLAAHHFLSW